MKDLQIVAVTMEDKEVIVSLLGGESNVVGTIRFFEKDDIQRHNLRRTAEAIMHHGFLVDLAISFITKRWRLIGPSIGYSLGGIEPTKLDISQTPPAPKKKPDHWNQWGLEAPWKDEES